MDPFLTQADKLETNIIVTGFFAARVWTSYYGQGNEIKVHSVTDALVAISETFELAGKSSPLYKAHQVYNLPVQERCIKGMRRLDPPPIPQLALPIAVVIQAYMAAYAATADGQDSAPLC